MAALVPPGAGGIIAAPRDHPVASARVTVGRGAGGALMTLRLNSLKTRTALAMSAVIVAILLANALYMILTKRAELREGIEQRALTFALLTRAPICTGYETYKDSGFSKF